MHQQQFQKIACLLPKTRLLKNRLNLKANRCSKVYSAHPLHLHLLSNNKQRMKQSQKRLTIATKRNLLSLRNSYSVILYLTRLLFSVAQLNQKKDSLEQNQPIQARCLEDSQEAYLEATYLNRVHYLEILSLKVALFFNLKRHQAVHCSNRSEAMDFLANLLIMMGLRILLHQVVSSELLQQPLERRMRMTTEPYRLKMSHPCMLKLTTQSLKTLSKLPSHLILNRWR